MATLVASSRILLSRFSIIKPSIFFPPFLRTVLKLRHLRYCQYPVSAQGPVEAPTQVAGAPSTRRPNVVNILEERGLIESMTSEKLRVACSNASTFPLKVYCGFDPTAESLHLGNLLGIIVLSWFQLSGHKVVALIGGATGRIGDPSGKSLERPALDEETIEKNCAGISNILERILGKEKVRGKSDGSYVLLNNYDWWKEKTCIDFHQEVGRFANVRAMMAKECVKKRLTSEEGISHAEFSYQMLQAYDFFYLFKNMGVNVQIGGSDQWGNITAGIELIRKKMHAERPYGLTFPLLLKSDGTKFGKSEEGALWLSPTMLSPFKFYQYLFSVPNSDVIKFLKMLTFLSMDEINDMEEKMKQPCYTPNTAQRRLAEEVTQLVHGEEGLQEALKTIESLNPGAETTLNSKTIEGIPVVVPSRPLAYDVVLNSNRIDLCVSIGPLDSKCVVR